MIEKKELLSKLFGVLLVILAGVHFYFEKPPEPSQEMIQPVSEPKPTPESTLENETYQKALQTPSKPKPTAEEVRAAEQRVRDSYQKLMAFKGKSMFHDLGFGDNNKESSAWLEEIQAMRSDFDALNIPFTIGLAATHIVELAFEYFETKGVETTRTKELHTLINEAFDMTKLLP